MSDETVIEAAETPAPEAQTEAPAPETPPEAQGAAPEGQVQPPATPEPPPKKSPVAQLQGRVGYLTKTLSAKDVELDTLRRQNETYAALLGNRAPPADGAAPPPAAPPPPPAHTSPVAGSPEFQEAVRQEAANQAFQAEADRINVTGKQKLGAAWDESLSALSAMGMLQRPFVEAALATDDPTAVLHALGQDLDEAARIASLPPIRMAVELAKLGAKAPAAAPTPAAPAISGAPPPIRPVAGAVNPQLDVYDPKLSAGDRVSDDFLRARSKSGLPWYNRHKSA